jgi:hypothetical protein
MQEIDDQSDLIARIKLPRSTLAYIGSLLERRDTFRFDHL